MTTNNIKILILKNHNYYKLIIINMKIKKNEVLNFNTDFLEIHWTFKNIDSILKWVDWDNSNSVNFLKFNLEKITGITNYWYRVSFKKDNLTLFAYYKWKQVSEMITTRDKFVVYWTWFRNMESKKILDFIKKHINPDRWNTFQVRRLDLALDVERNISDWVLNYFEELKQKSVDFRWKNWELETHYIWEKNLNKNKRFLLRIYDKLKDIKKKNLQSQYIQYLSKQDVTRIEIEFRSELTKDFTLEKILDKEYLLNLFTKYLKKHTSIFEKLKTKDVSKLKSLNKKSDLERLRYDEIYRKNYIITFLWYAKNILAIGRCPINLLILKQIIWNETIQKIKSITNSIFTIERYNKLKWEN